MLVNTNPSIINIAMRFKFDISQYAFFKILSPAKRFYQIYWLKMIKIFKNKNVVITPKKTFFRALSCLTISLQSRIIINILNAGIINHMLFYIIMN